MQDRRNIGYAYLLSAILLFTLQDAISKHLVSTYPAPFVTMVRFCASAVLGTIFCAFGKTGLRAVFRTRQPWLQVGRGALLGTQVVLTILSFRTVGLAYTQGIYAAGPLLVTALSIPLLSERVGRHRWTAIACGFLGVILLIRSPSTGPGGSIAVPIVGVTMFAFYAISTRYVGRTDAPLTSFLYMSWGGAGATMIWGMFHLVPVANGDLLSFAVLCVIGAVSHYLLIGAYEGLDASSIQPVMYLQVVLGSIVAVTVFGESLTLSLVVGGMIVVVAGIYSIYRERTLQNRSVGS